MIPQPLQLALTGFVQVFFVSVNTYFIARDFEAGILIAAFLISYIWSINVKKVAFGTQGDRISYATGAALGSYAGYKSGAVVLNIINSFSNYLIQ